MLIKFVMIGFKYCWCDYFVFFLGLIMFSVIFYMFEVLVIN